MSMQLHSRSSNGKNAEASWCDFMGFFYTVYVDNAPALYHLTQISPHPGLKKLQIRPRHPKYISHEEFHILKGGSQKNPSRFKETQS